MDIDVSIWGVCDLLVVKEYVGKFFGFVIIVEYIIKNWYNYILERKWMWFCWLLCMFD